MYIEDDIKLNSDRESELYNLAIDFFLWVAGQYTGYPNFSVIRKEVTVFRETIGDMIRDGVLFPDGNSVESITTPTNYEIIINGQTIDYHSIC